jgi:heme-degrading monooxygenase HmoA
MRTLRLVAVLAPLAAALACSHKASGPPTPDSATAPPTPAIARVWHGRVPAERADEYSAYLANAITKFRTLPGNLGYEMLRDDAGPETHFMVVSYWTSADAIHAYAGEDITRTRALPRDQEFLIDPEPTVHNYRMMVQNVAR